MKSCTANTTVRTATTSKRAACSVPKSCCRSMPHPLSLTVKPYGMQLRKRNGEKKRGLHTALTLLCRTSFPCRRTSRLPSIFLLEKFVSRDMVVDFAVHFPDKEDDGIFNPHFHVMCPIRPLDEHGRWSNKQRREYLLDEHGERIRD